MRRAGILLAALLWLAAPAAAETGGVSGRVSLGLEGVRLGDVGPIVIFLDGVSGALAFDPPSEVRTIHQKNARFSPGFLAVAVGQRIAMPNDDAIFHNVFSFSKPNDFDLGLYPSGESRSLRFAHSGLVRMYCSIHESMSASIFVAPSPWFAIANGEGGFEISDVPVGSYRVRVWNEKLPESSRSVSVRAGQRARVDVALGAPTR
jgi:plastocyanin